MKRYLVFLFAILMVMVSLPLVAGAADSKAVSVTLETVDIATGKALGNVCLDIWKVTMEKNGSTSECVKDGVKTNAKGILKVKLPLTDANTKYEVHISGAPKGYTDWCTAKTFTVQKAKTVKVSLTPMFTCKMKVVDKKGNPVVGATVNICESSAKTGKDGVAVVKNVSYGKRNVRVTVVEDGKTYTVYNKQLSLKGRPGKTISKPLHIKARKNWQELIIHVVAKKPIIYLYSKIPQAVNVRLEKPENLIYSYPLYNEDTGWNVFIRGDGLLTDQDTGRSLYSLYWEGWNNDREITDTGFVVSGSNTAAFLEEKLAMLGLTDREAEEFIIYWLPQMQENEYNYIRFDTEEEINDVMPLAMNPTPDAVIRVWMSFTALDAPIDVKEQELVPVDRNAYAELNFYAVEWGGSEF